MEISCVKNGEEEVSTAPEETQVFDNAKGSCDEDKQVEQISNSAQSLEGNPNSVVKVSCDEEKPHVREGECEGTAILEKEKEEEHPHHVPKKQRICARNCSVDLQLQEAAEMVLILSGMGQMRAGRPPTEFERDLMANARQKLGSLVEKHLLPRDLVSKESVETMIEDLGLHRLQDHTKSPAPLKSIAERAADAINKLEQARLPAMSTAMVSTSLAKVEHGPAKIAVGGTSVALPAQRVQVGPLKHLVPSSQPLPVMQPFMPAIPVIAKTSVTQPVPPELKASVVTSSPFLPNAMIVPASTITPQAQVSLMAPVLPLAPILRAENQAEMRPVVVSQPATTLMPSTQMPGQVLKSLSVPVMISEKKSAPSSAEMTMTVGRDHSKGFLISPSNAPPLVQMTSVSTANVGKDNIGKNIDLSVQAPRKVEGNRDFNDFHTTSVQFEQKDLKDVSMPAASPNVHTKQIPHQPVESLTTRATHSDIARNVQKILQSKPADLRQWELPSKAYMNAPVTCQVCKITVADIDNILVCDSCEKAVHIKCLQAYNQRGTPKVGDWHCPKCLVASNGRQLPPKYGRVGKSSLVRRTTAISNKSNPQASHAKKIETSQLKSRQHTVVSNGMNTTPEIPIHVDLTHANNRHVSQETGDTSGDHKHNSEMHLIQSVKEAEDGSNEPLKKELSEETSNRFAGVTGTIPENENYSSPTNAVTQFPNQQSANTTVSLLGTHDGIRDPQLNLQLNTNSHAIKQSQTLSNSHGADRLRIQQGVRASEDLFQNTSIQRLPSKLNEMSCSQLSERQTSKDGGGDPRPESEDAQLRTLHQSSIVDAKSSNEGTDQGRVTEEEDAYRVEWVGDKLEVSGGKTYYQSCRVKGVLYKLNDYALFRPETPNVPPYIAKLQVLWDDDDTGSKWVRVNWCYYPNDIPQEVPRPTTPEKDEVYESNHGDSNLVGSIQGPCQVLPSEKYREEIEKRRALLKGGHEIGAFHPVFLCKWFYDAPKGVFLSVTQ